MITIITGCMFAGKTTALIERLRAMEQSGHSVIAFKHASDDRYDADNLCTHHRQTFPVTPVDGSPELMKRVGKFSVIGIDEAQFFNPGIVDAAVLLSACGRTVLLAGLSFDAWGKPFGPMPELKRIAGVVVELTAPCKVCGDPAKYSQRIGPFGDGDLVRCPELFEPRCGKCFEPLAVSI